MPEEGDERRNHQSQVMLKRENLDLQHDQPDPVPYALSKPAATRRTTLTADPELVIPKKRVSFSKQVTTIMPADLEPEVVRFVIHVLTDNRSDAEVSPYEVEPPLRSIPPDLQTPTLTLLEEVRELFNNSCCSNETLQEILAAICVGKTCHPKIQLS